MLPSTQVTTNTPGPPGLPAPPPRPRPPPGLGAPAGRPAPAAPPRRRGRRPPRRRAAAARAGAPATRRRGWTPAPDAPRFGELREEMLDKLADAVGAHLDTGVLETLLERGAPPGLPFVPPGAP